MAFTLIGTGTSIAKSVNPKAYNTIVASAACQYHDGSTLNGKVISNFNTDTAKKTGKRYCLCCGKETGTYTGPSYSPRYSWVNGNRVPTGGPGDPPKKSK